MKAPNHTEAFTIFENRTLGFLFFKTTPNRIVGYNGSLRTRGRLEPRTGRSSGVEVPRKTDVKRKDKPGYVN